MPLRRLLCVLFLLAGLGLASAGCPGRSEPPPGSGGTGFPGGTGGGGHTGQDGGTQDGGLADGGSPDAGRVDGGGTPVDLRFKLLPSGPTQWITQVQQTSTGVDSAAYGMATNGYSIPAMTWNSAGYTLIGVRPVTGARTYQSNVRQETDAGLPAAVQQLGNDGYAVTAMTWNSVSGFTAVGLRDLGNNLQFLTNVRSADDAALANAAQSLASTGYVITAMVFDGTSYTLVGEKPVSSTALYSASVREVANTAVSSTAQDLGINGYVVTAVTVNATGYVLLGVRDTASSRTFSTNVQFVSGVSLPATVAALGDAGYVPTAAYSDDDLNGYLVIGTK